MVNIETYFLIWITQYWKSGKPWPTTSTLMIELFHSWLEKEKPNLTSIFTKQRIIRDLRADMITGLLHLTGAGQLTHREVSAFIVGGHCALGKAICPQIPVPEYNASRAVNKRYVNRIGNFLRNKREVTLIN